MSILADTQIKQLCTPPTFVIIEKVRQPQDPQHAVYFRPKEVTSFTHMLEEEVVSINKRYFADEGIVSYRKLNDKELADFKPMISPFVADSIKVLETDKGPQRILIKNDNDKK